jgi:hypothetical protein
MARSRSRIRRGEHGMGENNMSSEWRDKNGPWDSSRPLQMISNNSWTVWLTVCIISRFILKEMLNDPLTIHFQFNIYFSVPMSQFMCFLFSPLFYSCVTFVLLYFLIFLRFSILSSKTSTYKQFQIKNFSTTKL